MRKKNTNSKKKEPEKLAVDYEKKIKFLEEELVRQQDLIDKLRQENLVLLNTALKNSERKVDTRFKKQVYKKGGTEHL